MSTYPFSAADSGNTSAKPAGFLLSKFGLIAAAIALILAAWAGQTVIVILLGLAVAAAGLSKLWSILSLKGVHCERCLSEQRVFPGEYLELKLRVVNRKLLPLPWLQVNDEVPAGFVTDLNLIPSNRPGFSSISQSASILWYSSMSWKYRLLCNKRGYYPLGPLTVASGDIFGFYPSAAVQPVTDYIIVYPKISPLGRLSISSLYPLGEAKSEKRIFEDPSHTFGVRDYSPSDSLRRIHWKASARQQQLQVKVFEPTTTLKVAMFLVMDSFQYQGIWNEDGLELGISTAASLASYLVDKNSQVGLWTNTRLADSGFPARIPPGSGVSQLVKILEALAKVVSTSSGPFYEFFHGERKGLPMGTTLVFIFAGFPEKLKEVLVDLRENGYKLLVFQTGAIKNEERMADITWYNIRSLGELAELIPGDNQC